MPLVRTHTEVPDNIYNFVKLLFRMVRANQIDEDSVMVLLNGVINEKKVHQNGENGTTPP